VKHQPFQHRSGVSHRKSGEAASLKRSSNSGLEQYEAVFRKNEVDESVLSELTEAHLREMGFPLGARLKILKAIGAPHADELSVQTGAAITKSAPPSASPEARDERRQVSVMFSDLVGKEQIPTAIQSSRTARISGRF
jgi:hypothetical protein